MSLCHLCKNIPWEDLPTVPEGVGRGLSGHTFFQPLYKWPKDARGYAHHQTLGALHQAASSCGLCNLIFASAANVRKEMEELESKRQAGSRHYGLPTWELFLVKREEGGDGCWVISFVGNVWKGPTGEARIVAALGICVRDGRCFSPRLLATQNVDFLGDPLESVVAGRPVEENSGSPTALGRARTWLQECDKHATCDTGDTLLPSRIIDVGVEDSQTLRLWEPVPKGTLGKYATLSYCWEPAREFTKIQVSLEERKRGLAIEGMPKTYQDTIRVIRALGFRYLWVDSLCICSDEGANWERQSAKVTSIYSNAYLNVAASRAKDVAEGLFNPTSNRTYVEMDYSRNGIHGRALTFSLPLREELIKYDYIQLPHEPLSKEAWGLQERVLSRRVLLYGTSQVFYECNEGYRGEDGLTLSTRHMCAHKSLEDEDLPVSSVSFFPGVTLKTGPKRRIIKGWYSLVALYGPKELACASDKLPAIAGLARLYSEKIGEHYLAGLWRGHLIDGMLWQGLRFRRVPQYRAPSWSWASGDGTPGMGLDMDYEEIAEVLDANVTLKGEDPFGEVTGGWIKLRAPLEQLHLVLDDWDPKARTSGHSLPKVCTANGNPKGTIASFDFAYRDHDAAEEAEKLVKSLEGVDIFALVLVKYLPWHAAGATGDGNYRSLIVRKVHGTENYQRLGWLSCPKEDLGKRPEDQRKEDFPSLTLI